MKKKLIRVSTEAYSLNILLQGQLKFMNKHYEVVAVSGYSKMLDEVRDNEGVRTKVVEMTRKITIGKDIMALWEMFRFFRREKPLIVHTHSPKAGTVGMMAAWLARVPIRLHTIAGLPLMEAKGAKRKLLNFVEKVTYRFATKVYPNSFGLRDYIISEKFCKPDKLHVMGQGSSNGIDTSFFDPSLFSEVEKGSWREKLKIDKNDFVFIFVGRVVKDKGVNELISAFSRINRDNCKLILVGYYETELSPLLPETIQEIQSNGKILSVGYKEDVRPYLAISNAMVFPSYREGYPNAVMQAVAMGLPAIVSNINGCNEIISHNVNGVIIPPKDDNAALDAMHYFIDNPSEVERMASQTRTSILDSYEQHRVWDAILMEYRKLENTI